MKKFAPIYFLFAIFLFVNQTNGQTPSPTPKSQTEVKPADDEDVVRITSNLIQIDVVVTDKKGKPIPNLKPEDFEIFENDKKQNITTFSYVGVDAPIPTNLPKTNADKNAPPVIVKLKPEQVRRTIALIVDDLNMAFDGVYFVRKALKKFVDEQMQPGDLVAIIRTSSGVGALQQFTADKQQLYAAIERVKYSLTGRSGIGVFDPVREKNGDDYTRGLDEVNELRDQIYTVGTLGAINYVVRGMRELPGRKAVLLLSNGFGVPQDPYTLIKLRHLTDLANRAGVVIYTLNSTGLPYTGITAADNFRPILSQPGRFGDLISSREMTLLTRQGGLSYLADETGGFAVRNTNDMGDGIRRVMDDQNSFYLIGYQPEAETFDPKRNRFNKLKIKVKLKDIKVRYRSGFFGIKDEEIKPVELTARQKVVMALTSPFSSGAVGLRLTTIFGNTQNVGSYIRALLHVNGRDITFTKEADGFYKAEFSVLAVTFDDNGAPIDQAGESYSFRADEKWYQRLLQRGFVYHLSLPIKKAGAYQMRVALIDEPSSNVGSATQFIQVPDIKKERLLLSGLVLTKYEPDMKKETAESEDSGVAGETAPLTDAAVRQFRIGDTVMYGYQIYNTKIDKQTKQQQLKTRLRLFRNGKEVFAGEEIPFDFQGQTDLKRLLFRGTLRLGSELEPGEYVLQIVATDLLAKEKNRTATTWIEFEIIK